MYNTTVRAGSCTLITQKAATPAIPAQRLSSATPASAYGQTAACFITLDATATAAAATLAQPSLLQKQRSTAIHKIISIRLGLGLSITTITPELQILCY
jgi:hypothetical protein